MFIKLYYELIFVYYFLAYCRNPYNGQWYCFDDTTVTAVNEGELVTSAAYILFYQRRGLLSPSTSSSASSTSEHWASRLIPPPISNQPTVGVYGLQLYMNTLIKFWFCIYFDLNKTRANWGISRCNKLSIITIFLIILDIIWVGLLKESKDP